MLRAVRKRGLVSGVLVLALGLPAVARADDVHELRHDVATDVVVTATALTLIVGAELAKSDLAPADCRWCDREADGTDALNGVDHGVRSALRWHDTKTAGHAADAMGFLVAPAATAVTMIAAAGRDEATRHTPTDLLLTLETVSLSGVLNEVTKLAVGRERPFVHALAPSERPKTAHPADNDLSFYSGHTSMTFTLATASGTIASLRGYRLAPLVWSSGLTIAAVTGYLRIAADKHYFTDVVTGMIVGAAIGTLFPLIFHGRRAEEPARLPLVDPSRLAAPAFPVTLSGTF